MSTIIVGAVLAGLFILAIRHIVKSHKKGGCSSCEGCTGCSHMAEIEKELDLANHR